MWFTEVGSRIEARGPFPAKSLSRQDDEVAYLVDELSTGSPRIDRLYYYSYCPRRSGFGFDSGLYGIAAGATGGQYCGSNGTARPALATYRSRTLKNPFG